MNLHCWETQVIRLKDEILELLDNTKKIGIVSHVNPDGDGFCASLALHSLLKAMGFESDIIVDSMNLSLFDFLMGDAELRIYDPGLSYDTLFVLDCNSSDRLGDRAALLRTAEYIIVIDHHESESGTINSSVCYIDTSHVSVGIIIYQIFENEIGKLDVQQQKYLADCIYTTILNDTNNFCNANTNPEAYEVSAKLMKHGLKPQQVYQSYFQSFYPREMRYVGEVLSTIETYENGRILCMHSDIGMTTRNGIDKDSQFSVTKWVQGLKGIDAILFIREDEPNLFRVSWRSLKLNVNEIAVRHGGGGHRNASGCTLKGDMPSLKQDLIKEISVALRLLDSNVEH